MAADDPNPPWWHGGVIYQVYPRSFQDSDGDGVGDLAGIRSRLGYLAGLGIDAIWLSPVFPSPMADFGYDVADYCGIDPLFGDLAGFDRLLAESHALGLRVLLDFVPNHTSDQHPWFVESRSSRDNPRRDWYFWRDPAPGGGPPNNWTSDMGGSAWTFDEGTGQYYPHAFLREQPDLNWRHPAVRAAMEAVLRFWFDRGVDGFRVDVLWHCIKAEGLPDNPLNPDYHPAQGDKHRVLQTHSANRPEIHDLAAGLRCIADTYRDRLLVGEIFLPLPELVRYYGTDSAPGVHLPFNFRLLEAAWDAAGIAQWIAEYEAALPPGAWPNWVMGSHDAPRLAARLGEAQARVAAMLLLTLRGTPTLYQGDELGIGEVAIRRTCASPGWASAATAPARRWHGTTSRTRGSARPHRGSRSIPTGHCAMSPHRTATPARCSRCTGGCWRCAGRGRHWRWASCGCFPADRTCCALSAAAARNGCWWHSTSPRLRARCRFLTGLRWAGRCCPR